MKKDGIENTSLLNQSLESAFKKCLPIVTTLEITQKCNLKCAHCYNYDRSKAMPKDISDNLLDANTIINTIDQIGELGSLYLNISGGEALLHPHINDFIKRARSYHMEVRLKTNALALGQEIANEIIESGVRAFDISLYGIDNDTYEKFCGVKNGFTRAITGVKVAIDSGLPVNINLIIHRSNAHQLGELITLCNDLNVQFNIATEVTERYDGSLGARDHEVTAAQFEELLLGEHGEFFMTNNSDKALQCSCARSVLGINSVGDVFPCIGAPIKSGSMKTQKLKDIWNNSKEFKVIRNLKNEDFKDCMVCDVIDFCDRSSGSCQVNSGNYTGCDPQLLMQAKTRAKHKDRFL